MRQRCHVSYVTKSTRGWLGEAKVSCILHHRGIQLRLADCWVRPAVLAAGKGKGGMYLFLLFFTFTDHICPKAHCAGCSPCDNDG